MFRRRRPLGTLVAALVIGVLGALLAVVIPSAAAGSRSDRLAPRMLDMPRVESATASTLELSWRAARDNVAVTEYDIYVDNRVVTRVTEFDPTAERVRGMVDGLRCGTSYPIAIDAVDAAENHSDRISLVVSTAACADTSAPSAPTGFRQAATTETSVVVTWSPSSDNVGVVGYDLFVAGLKVSTSREASSTLTNLDCATQYLLEVAAYDAAGNHSAPARMLVRRCSARPSQRQRAH